MIYSKDFYLSYGGVFTGSGDMWGHKLYAGYQSMLTRRTGVDINIAGSLINHTYYFEGNPEWERIEQSNGIELSLNLLLKIEKGSFQVSPFVGPALRYSYEHHARIYGITYNSTTGGYDFECQYYEEQGFRAGFNVGTNIEYKVFHNLYIGPRLAISYFPRNSYIFSFLGLQFRWE